MIHYFNDISLIKAIAAAAFGWFLSVTTPIHPFVLLVFLLVFSDLITGLIAAKKTGEKLESKRMWKTIYKLTSACILFSSSLYFQQVFGMGKILTYSFAFMICLSELKSLAENASKIWGIDLWNRIKELIPHLGKKTDKK